MEGIKSEGMGKNEEKRKTFHGAMHLFLIRHSARHERSAFIYGRREIQEA
jgi:hypothetical protein